MSVMEKLHDWAIAGALARRESGRIRMAMRRFICRSPDER
jgi:hypothetical protein